MAALLAGPLSDYFGQNKFLRYWLSIRRNLGVAAFGYAAFHFILYLIDMRQLEHIFDELELPGIWTGWIAFGLLFIPAAISSDKATRLLKQAWKPLQRLVYGALLLGLVHWAILGWSWPTAFIHLAPLIVAWILRVKSQPNALTKI